MTSDEMVAAEQQQKTAVNGVGGFLNLPLGQPEPGGGGSSSSSSSSSVAAFGNDNQQDRNDASFLSTAAQEEVKTQRRTEPLFLTDSIRCLHSVKHPS